MCQLFFQAIDLDHSGEISKEEFMKFWTLLRTRARNEAIVIDQILGLEKKLGIEDDCEEEQNTEESD